MKKVINSGSRFLYGIGIMIAIIAISASCSKSSMANITGTGGTGGNPELPLGQMRYSYREWLLILLQ